MRKTATPELTTPLTPPVFHILLALADQDRHGYGIMQEVATQTNGKLQLGPGTLYGCLKRMLAAGLVIESERGAAGDSQDERRRYYQATDLGMRVVREEAKRLEEAVRAAQMKRLLPQKGRL